MTLATGWIPTLDKIFVPQTTVTQDQLQAGTMANNNGLAAFVATTGYGQAKAPVPAPADEGERKKGFSEARFASKNSHGTDKVSVASSYGENYTTQEFREGAKVVKDDSAGVKEKSNGNARNGTRTKSQVGAWDISASHAEAGSKGVSAGGSAQGNAGAQIEGGASKQLGTTELDAKGRAWGGAEGRAYGAASASLESGVYTGAGFEGRVGAGVEGQSRITRGPFQGSLNGKTGVGAETSNGFSVGAQLLTDKERASGLTGKSGLEFSAGGFAGAKAEGTATVGVYGNQAAFTAAGYAGVGAKASFKAGIETDNQNRSYLNVGGQIGAALGLGASFGVELRINITPVVKAFHAVADGVKKGWKGIEEFGKKALEGLKEAGHAVADTAKKAWEGAKGVANKIGSAFKNFFNPSAS
jgi:hypothetical protein